MIVSIDFDETYTKSPWLFNEIIALLSDSDHQPMIVTYRHRDLDYDPQLWNLENLYFVPVYYTDGKAKKPFMENLGIKVDIWIEDNPRAVYEDSAWKHDSPELHAWREQNKAKLNVA